MSEPDLTYTDLFDDWFSGHKRSAFGFAVGHRVRVTARGAHHGLTGITDWVGGCSLGNPDASAFHAPERIERCAAICPNVRFRVTHRIGDDGAINTDVQGGHITCPPAHLEHCD